MTPARTLGSLRDDAGGEVQQSTGPSAPAVWCSSLRKTYGRQVAVDNVSFEVGRAARSSGCSVRTARARPR